MNVILALLAAVPADRTRRSRLLRPLVYAGALSALLAGQPATAQCEYEVTIILGQDCPIFGPQPIRAFSMNESGQIVGDYGLCGDDLSYDEPFIWDPSSGFQPIPVPPDTLSGSGEDVNDLGHVVGIFDIENDGLGNLGFLFDGRSVVSLGTLPGGTWSEAYAINNKGQIVGVAYNEQPQKRAFTWVDGQMTDFGALLGTPSSRAKDISVEGHIVGWMGNSFLHDGEAFHWRDGNLTALGVLPGGIFSTAEALNKRGDVVGWGLFPGRNRAILWKDGTIRDLGMLPGLDRCAAIDINDRGQVVGDCWDPGSAGFIWQNGVMTSLDDLVPGDDVDISHAYAINNSGQIAVYGNIPSIPAAFLLTPIPGPPGDVNGDCRVSTSDLLDLLAQWGPCRDACFADVNGDGVVGIDDLVTLLENWG